MGRAGTVARLYHAFDASIAGVRLTLLRLEKEIELGSTEVLDAVSDLRERYANTPGYVVEVVRYNKRGEEVEASVFATVVGTVLFPRPARLIVVRVIEEELRGSRPLQPLPAVKPPGELYISLGRIELPEGVWGVILETDRGVRLVSRDMLAGVKKDSSGEPGSSGA